MSFRRRITIAAAAAVAVAVLLASALTYLLAAHQLRKQVDEQLRSRSVGLRFISRTASNGLSDSEAKHLAEAFKGSNGEALRTLRRDGNVLLAPGGTPLLAPGANPFGNLTPHPDQVRGYQQLVDARSKVLFRSSPNITLPVDAATRKLAASGGRPFYRDANAEGTHLRILAEPLRTGYALQLAQPLTSVDHLLRRLRIILALLDIGGIALAALLGRLVAGAAVAPVRRLTLAMEHVRRTQDLSERIQPASEDEIGRLAGGFNAMLDALQSSIGALDASVHAQRQLVADASHELRTPVTSVRTNIEVLRQQPLMPVADRQRLLDDVVEQTEELTALMNDLIELARGEQQQGEHEDVRLDLVVREAVERAQRHSPQTPFELSAQPLLLSGAPQRLVRAVNNLIDNAVAYSPAGAPVEIELGSEGLSASAVLSVRDHGPGIAEQDLPHVFDRFYRSAEARGRPGSGLGLAIVRQVAEQHGGAIVAARAGGGGTLMRLWLPGAEAVESEVEQPILLQQT
ncbi:MAG TPA: HAMP domain-containing sensor histidine kinase [Solirubrobacteraceae bacterium]|nr:HAMP domain-containing sensor histidine kinase [Solirubrobacteraceae bacterium]